MFIHFVTCPLRPGSVRNGAEKPCPSLSIATRAYRTSQNRNTLEVAGSRPRVLWFVAYVGKEVGDYVDMPYSKGEFRWFEESESIEV